VRMHSRLIARCVCIGLLTSVAWADPPSSGRTVIDRDKTYEENLRWQASDDQTITPSRVIRWMRGVRGAAVFASVSPAEFQPIVNVKDSRVRIVATIAFKFR
jgi:hypothetical protein